MGDSAFSLLPLGSVKISEDFALCRVGFDGSILSVDIASPDISDANPVDIYVSVVMLEGQYCPDFKIFTPDGFNEVVYLYP